MSATEDEYETTTLADLDQPQQPVEQGPFGQAAHAYWDAGWRGMFPVKPHSKDPYKLRRTHGRDALDPSYADLQTWVDSDKGDGNIAVHLTDADDPEYDIVGVDIDSYGGKVGGATFAALEAEVGPLDPTWRSTSRDDGVSGIRFYRVPKGLRWPDSFGPSIECVSRAHRYAIVSPSIHPEGRVYNWIRPDGTIVLGRVPEPPKPGDMALMRAEWVEHFTGGELDTGTPKPSLQAGQAWTWLQAHNGTGRPCHKIAAEVAKGIDPDNRHNSMRSRVRTIVLCAAEGHDGANTALGQVHDQFLAAVADDRPHVSEEEFGRAVDGVISEAVGQNKPMPPMDPCKMGNLAGLIPPELWPREHARQQEQQERQRQERTPNGEATMGETTGNGDEVRRMILTPASCIKPRPVFWLWDGRIALGTLGLLAGREGLGKSTLAYWMASRITRGELPGKFAGTPKSVLVAATEDSWEHTIVPRLIAAGGDLDRVFRVEVVNMFGIHVGITMPRDLPALEHQAGEVDAAMLLLDPLMSRLGDLDTHRDAEVRQALEPLVALADRVNMSVIGLIHHNKSGSADPLQLVMGSKAFTAVARSVHTVVIDPDDESETRRLFGTPKNNLGRTDLPTLSFTIEGYPVDTEEGPAWTGRLNWGEERADTIHDAMRAAADSEGGSAVKEASGWLSDYLASQGGEAASADAKVAAKKAGHSPSAIARARKRLGVQINEAGFPRATYWALPSRVSDQSPSRVNQSCQPPRGDDTTDMTGTTGGINQQVSPSRASRTSRTNPQRVDDTTGDEGQIVDRYVGGKAVKFDLVTKQMFDPETGEVTPELAVPKDSPDADIPSGQLCDTCGQPLSVQRAAYASTHAECESTNQTNTERNDQS